MIAMMHHLKEFVLVNWAPRESRRPGIKIFRPPAMEFRVLMLEAACKGIEFYPAMSASLGGRQSIAWINGYLAGV